MSKIKVVFFVLVLGFVVYSIFSDDDKKEFQGVVDLNKVLDIFADTLDDFAKNNKLVATASAAPTDGSGRTIKETKVIDSNNNEPTSKSPDFTTAVKEKAKEIETNNTATTEVASATNNEAAEITEQTPEATTFKPLSEEEEKKNISKIDQFLKKYTAALNKAKLVKYQLGTQFSSGGAIIGFKDDNKNGKKEAQEKQVFLLEIDAERDRIVATDTQNNYHRDYHYRSHWHSSGTGLFAGYFIGSMLGRQSRFGGFSSSRFRNMRMSPKSYHSSATSKAKSTFNRTSSKSSSARSSGGSRSFFRGK